MKLLLANFDTSEEQLLKERLDQWGFAAVSCRDGEQIESLLKNEAGIDVAVLGRKNSDCGQWIQSIRDHSSYIYTIRLAEDETDGGEALKSGSDNFLIQPTDADEMIAQISAARQIMYAGEEWRALCDHGNFEVLDLNKGLKYVLSNRELLFELIGATLDSVKKFPMDIQSIRSDAWKELGENADSLGAHEFAGWIKRWREQVPNGPGEVAAANMRCQLAILESRLRNANLCLKEFGFFAKEDGRTEPLKNARVLLVEDMHYNRLIVKKILAKYDCKIVEATNGSEAIEIWEKSPNFDLIIMDINMPVLDGFAATRKIRELEGKRNQKRVPILAVTALAMEGDREKCLQAGCDEYQSKPVEASLLIGICSDLIADREEPGTRPAPQEPFKIDSALLKTDDQIYRFAFEQLFGDLHIELTCLSESSQTIEEAGPQKYDLIVLDAEKDMDLAYHLLKRLPQQRISLIVQSHRSKSLFHRNSQENFVYPFRQNHLLKVLERHSQKLVQNRKRIETLKDIGNFGKLEERVGFQDTVRRSDRQLAVWQKSVHKIGGDLVLSRVFNYHGRFGLLLADVAGHDIKSGYTASWFSGLVKGAWSRCSDPLDLLIYLNSLFDHDTGEEDKRFICALALMLDRMRGKLRYANSGIPEGVLVSAESGEGELIKWRGVPMGMFPHTKRFDCGEIDFRPGDRLYLATDGVLEEIPNEVFFDIDKEKRNASPQEALESIVDFVTRSVPIADDLTLAVFEAKTMPEISNGYRQTILSSLEKIDSAIQKLHGFVVDKLPGRLNWHMVSIAVREAVTNAVVHGNKKDERLPVDIDVELLEGALRVTVSDLGAGFDYPDLKSHREKRDPLRVQGRGIGIMKNVAKTIDLQGSGIRMEFGLDSGPAG